MTAVDNAVNQFRALLEEQIARTRRMENAAPAKDFTKLSKATIGVPHSHMLWTEMLVETGLFGLLTAAFLHQASDKGGLFLLLAEQGVALLLEGLAVIVEGDDLFNNSSRIKILDGELCDDFLRVFPERFECKHY